MSAIAQRAPAEIHLRLLNGKGQALSDFRGRVVVLQIISTRCSRCARIVQLLNTLQRDLGVQPVAIAINAQATEMIEEFVRHASPEFPVALGNKKDICDLLGLPNEKPLFLPVIAFVDRGGMVRALSAPGTEFFAQAETTFPQLIRKLQEDAG